MERTTRYLAALAKSSLNAERAFQFAVSPEYSHYPEVQRQTWAAATILHCDILRYVVSYENSTREGLVRLLWMGDIVSMLYEARNWFYRTGGPNLVSIATSNGYGTEAAQDAIKAIKKSYPLSGIDAFADYRNKVGHHYDPTFVAHLHLFSESDSRIFFDVLENYAGFSSEWAGLCKKILSHRVGPQA